MPYPLLKKLLFTLHPELAHDVVKHSSKLTPKWLLKSFTQKEHKCLHAKIGKTKIKNPMGLAAGFDKNGEMIDFLDALGFGYLELGSITALPCHGKPKPRIFRVLKDQSLINRMGLPNIGTDAFHEKFKKKKYNCF